MFEISSNNGSIFKYLLSIPFDKAVHELTLISRTIGPLECSLSIFQSFYEIAFVVASVFKSLNAEPFRFIIDPLACIRHKVLG